MNMMIAGSIINSLLGGLMGESKPSVGEDGAKNFDSLIKKLLLNIKEANSASNGLTSKTPETSGLRTGIYLKAFNTGLAAKGKSSDNAYLKSNDINMLTEFLLQCGYTEADARQYIGKLLEKHPDGMIPLSEFFSQIAAPETTGGKPYSSIIIDPSITPKFDSLLKDFGLTLEETDRTLNAARAADGGLDLDKLIAQLKATRNRMRGEKRGAAQDIPSARVLTKLEELGIQVQPDPAAGRVPMDDLITGLEQLKGRVNAGGHGIDNGFPKDHHLPGVDTTGRGHDGRLTWKIVQTGQENSAEVKNSAGQLPLDVKSSMDRIVERSVADGEKLELRLAGPSVLQLKSASSAGNNKTGESGHDAEDGLMKGPFQKNGKPPVNEGSRILEAELQEKLGRISDINGGSGYKKETTVETNRYDSKTKAVEILQEGGASVRFETLTSMPRNRQADNSFFPEHIVDQLGKQISRSVLKGDRIINLQLYPPELGTVKLSMEIKGNTLHLGMVTESSSVKEVMLAGAHELKAALLGQGIKLESLDVQVRQSFGQSLMNLNEGSGQEHQQYQKTNGDLLPGNDIQEEVLPDSRSMAGRVYLLNLEA
ncbi:MAG: flagellar hook-length control protein FliK [Proteobacteria bacterium]|nr:flagellar hook-length control protein FliK [Pseudomonadota bacterium]